MSMKCVHKGCGKTFTDDSEECIYHPGPPIFHEGQKGWKCCKPRVLTFDEFLSIPPCTTGKHSTVDETPEAEANPPAPSEENIPPPQPRKAQAAQAIPSTQTRAPQDSSSQSQAPAAATAPESESDDPDTPIPENVTCRRRGCGVSSSAGKAGPDDGVADKCVYHPGQAIFHEGSKGWSCCKRRVLEFDEFMKIQGCKTRDRHCFVGKKRKKREGGAGGEEEFEKLATVRHDFYQTGTTVHASIYLKKIDKSKSKVEFKGSGQDLLLDLKTQDGKEYSTLMPLYGKIDPAKSEYKVLGTKLDLTLSKIDGAGWPVLRSDEKQTGEIIQTGRAGRA